jgi:hypothetical protein
MPTSSAQQSHAENIRLVIAKQTTVAGSLQALLRAIASTIHEGVAKADPSGLEAFADHIDADPKSWSDAVMANTPLANETVLPIQGVSPDVQEAFASHGTPDKAPARPAASPGVAPAPAPPPAGAPRG